MTISGDLQTQRVSTHQQVSIAGGRWDTVAKAYRFPDGSAGRLRDIVQEDGTVEIRYVEVSPEALAAEALERTTRPINVEIHYQRPDPEAGQVRTYATATLKVDPKGSQPTIVVEAAAGQGDLLSAGMVLTPEDVPFGFEVLCSEQDTDEVKRRLALEPWASHSIPVSAWGPS